MNAFLPKTILVIEDEFLVALDIGEALKARGYDVKTVTSAEEGHGIAAGGGCDAVLLDHGLTGDDGGTLAAFLKAEGIPFAFCTGLPAADIHDRYPGVPLIEKPFREQDLIRVADGLFGREAA